MRTLLLAIESLLVLVLVYAVVRTTLPGQYGGDILGRASVALSEDGTFIEGYSSFNDGNGSYDAGRSNDIRRMGLTAGTDSRGGSYHEIEARRKDIEEVLKRATIEPYRMGGQTIGLRMTGLEKIKSAKSLGIESGDVIRSVNGHRLTSEKRAYQVFKKARSKATMRVEFLRGNEVNTLLISFK